MVIIAINIKNAILPYDEIFEKLSKTFLELELVVSGKVKTTTKYKKTNAEIRMVSNNENPKYFCIYPPGSTS